MKAYWGSGNIAPLVFDLGTRGEWSASRPGRFTRRERAPATQWIGGWVGPRVGSKEKMPSPTGNRKPVVQHAVLNYTNRAIRVSTHYTQSNKIVNDDELTADFEKHQKWSI